MASKNKLLGSGKIDELDVLVEEKVSVADFDVPCLMYSAGCLEGKVIKSSAELKKLVELGWKNHPGYFTRLPAWEHLFDKKVENSEDELDVEVDLSKLFKK